MSSPESATAEVTRETEAALTEAAKTLTETMQSGTPSEIGHALGEAITDVSAATRGFGNGLGEALEATARDELGDGVAGTAGTAAIAAMGEAVEAITEITTTGGAAVGELGGTVVGAVGGAAGHMFEAGNSVRDGDLGGAVHHVGEAVKDVGEAAVDVAVTRATAVAGMAAEAVEGGFAVGREIITGVVGTGAAAVEAISEAVSPQVPLFDAALVTAATEASTEVGVVKDTGEPATPAEEQQASFPGDDEQPDPGTEQSTAESTPTEAVNASFPGDDETPAATGTPGDAATSSEAGASPQAGTDDSNDDFGE